VTRGLERWAKGFQIVDSARPITVPSGCDDTLLD
jgi:hypothetical protein